jgi:hypothetical protein
MLNLNYKEVAEAHGGNKQSIAQAAAIGALGPEGSLLAVAAGQYIDMMRNGQLKEQVPQQTIAQQVLGIPSPAGLGATPQAAAMPAPQAAPPMGMPAPPAPPMDMPPEQPVQGMSMGGLTSLSVPDDMFDEPSNGSYRGGGIVAFAAGNKVEDEAMPDTFYGYNYRDPMANLAVRDQMFGAPQTKYEEEAEADYLRRRSPEYRKAAEKKDRNQFLVDLGANMMAGSSPYALQNIGAALAPAASSAAERAKERRAEEREIRRGLLDLEQGKNTRAAQRASQALEMQGIGIRGAEAETGRRFSREQDRESRAYDWQKFLINEAGETRRAGMRAAYDSAQSDPKVNVSADDYVAQGRGGQGDTVIPRMRVTERGSNNYWYEFPVLGNAPINPAQGAYAVGVTNVVKLANKRGLGVGISETGRLQFIGPSGKRVTLKDTDVQGLDQKGVRYVPK